MTTKLNIKLIILIILMLIDSKIYASQENTINLYYSPALDNSDLLTSIINHLAENEISVIKVDDPNEATIGIYFSYSDGQLPTLFVGLPTEPNIDLPSQVMAYTPGVWAASFNLSFETHVQSAVEYITGIALFSTKRCADATDHFELVVNLMNSSLEHKDVEYFADFYKGTCLALGEDYQNAILYLEKSHNGLIADGYSNGSPGAAVNLAWTYHQIQDDEAALEWINLYVENEKAEISQGIALGKRAQFFALIERYDDAIADLTAAIDLRAKDTPDLYILRGQMYLALYEWDSALADYNAAIELDPDYADAYYERGVLYYSILQTGVELRTNALADFQRYLELAPDGEKAADAARYVEQIETELEALNG